MSYRVRLHITSLVCLFVLNSSFSSLSAQESVDVMIHENGVEREEIIDLPVSMTFPIDILLITFILSHLKSMEYTR